MATGLSAEVPPEQWAMLKEPGLPLWGQSFEFPLGVGSSLLLGGHSSPREKKHCGFWQTKRLALSWRF